MRAPDSTSTDRPFPWLGLAILACAIFVSVTSEFLPTGLLPEMARELEVSESQVGLLITLFAGTVVLTAAPLTALTRNHSRKFLVVIVLLVFVVANVLAAIAPSYFVLAIARVIGGLAHGLFWAVVGAYAAHLVPKHQIGRAVAFTSGGATGAFVLGVPLGTALGHVLGWRVAFAIIAAIVLLLIALVARFLPAVEHRERVKTGEIPLPLRKDATVPLVVIVCLIVIVTMTAQNLFYTYIAPYLLAVASFDEAGVAPTLFLYGGAGAVGLVVAGLVADRFPRPGLVVALALIAVSVLVVALFPSIGWVVLAAVFVWGVAMGMVPPLMSSRMLKSASTRIRDVASAYFTTSFNLAIGGGALFGGIILDAFGLEVLPFVLVAVVIAGIGLTVASDAWIARRARAFGT